jgi:hypothetical protein
VNEEERVRHLLEEAGPRPEVPPEDLAKIKAAFRAEWQERFRPRKARRPSRLFWSLAASVLVILGLGFGWWLWPWPPVPVARVESGTKAGEEIQPGAALETGEEPAAFRLQGGPSLRLDAGSRVRLVSISEVRLERGAVYLDSEWTRGRGGSVAVHTPLGVVRDVGTQFEVRLLGATLRVRVRKGAVRVGPHQADAGTELILRDGGSLTRSRIAAYGPPWSWVLKAAPPIRIEGLTVAEVLDQVVHETGWTIRVEDVAVVDPASRIVVHGDVRHLTPDQVPEVVLPGAGLDYQVVDGVLILRAPR